MTDETRPPDPLTDVPTQASVIASMAVPSCHARDQRGPDQPAAALPRRTRHARSRGARDQGQRAAAGQHGRRPDRPRGGRPGAPRRRPGHGGHHRRWPAERGAAAHHRPRGPDHRDTATGCPRSSLPAGPGPRRLRPGADGRPRLVRRQAGAQAGARRHHRGDRQAGGDGPPDLDAHAGGAAGAGRPGRGPRPRRGGAATTRSTICTTRSSRRCWS